MIHTELPHELAAQQKAALWVFFWKMVGALQAYFKDQGAIGILPSPLGSFWFSETYVKDISMLRPFHLELREVIKKGQFPASSVAPFFGSYVDRLHGLSTALCGTEYFPPGLLVTVTEKLSRELHLHNSALAMLVSAAAQEYSQACAAIPQDANTGI